MIAPPQTSLGPHLLPIPSERNLATIMNLLRLVPTKKLQLEVLQVFMIFVANPHKSAPVHQILLKNRATIVNFLERSMAAEELQVSAEMFVFLA